MNFILNLEENRNISFLFIILNTISCIIINNNINISSIIKKYLQVYSPNRKNKKWWLSLRRSINKNGDKNNNNNKTKTKKKNKIKSNIIISF
jgi:hypothetical protein